MNEELIDILVENEDLDGLISLLNDPKYAYRIQVIHALKMNRTKKVFQVLLFVLRNDPDEDIRSACAQAIGSMKNISSLTPLIQALKDPSGKVRSRAAEGLGLLKDDRAASQLVRLLKDENPGVRRIAVHSLGLIGKPNLLQHLIPMLQDDDKYVVAATAGAIGRVGMVEGVEPLQTLLDSSSDKIIRSCVEGLARIENEKSLKVLKDYQETGNCPARIENVLNQAIVRLENKLFRQDMQNTIDQIKTSDADVTYKSFKEILEKMKDEDI